MIKFTGQGRDNRTLLGLGISGKNVEMLKKGNPIFIMGEELELPFDVLLFYGETEQEITELLTKHGFVNDDTVVTDTTRREKQ